MDLPTDRLNTALAGRYRIDRELGAGGMATVFLAEDPKHDRKVAIKVLKPELAAVLGAERFVVEIKTTASLQHPHILPLFDSGTANGFLFYVMPFIQGETIRERLNRETQFGVDEAVRIARDIADALDYAHRRGVIHRDIKPENILLHDGRPMVMDFGIALAVSAAAGGRMTETGLSLGTPHYMSPEQATADKEITGRSDVYSLASVLYEMLAGVPPHEGGSAQQVIMRIIADTPRPVTDLRRSVPPNVAAAVAKALEKLPADRFESARDFATALADRSFVTETSDRGRVVTRVSPEARRWRRIAVASAIAGAGAITALGFVATRESPASPLVRVKLPFPGAARFTSINTAAFDIDRDGTKIVFMGQEGGTDNLWIRDLGSLVARPLAGTLGASDPFFSPDGRKIAYVANPISGASASTGQLVVIPVEAGAPAVLVKDGVGRHGGDWGEDGFIYFPGNDGLIARVRADGGTVEVLSRLEAGSHLRHRFPQLLPDRKSLLVHVSGRDSDEDHVAVLDIGTGMTKSLIPRAFNGRFLPSGHIVYADADGALFAVPFDPSRQALTGPPRALADVSFVMGGGYARFAVSPSGVLLYQPAESNNDQLVWVDRSGASTPVDSSWRGRLRAPALSPDGSRLAVAVRQGSRTQIIVKQLPTGPRTLVSLRSRENWRPQWTRDGRRVGFLAGTGPADMSLQLRRFDASDTGETLLPASGALSEVEWHPDGRTLILRRGSLLGTRDVLRFTPGVDSVPRMLLGGPQDDYGIAISPNGRWLAYVSTESGRAEVYVRAFDNPSAGRTQVSVDGASVPVWARSGRELFWRGADGATMFTADVQTGATFRAGTPRVLFSRPEYVWDYFSRAFDISLDDRRFLMVSTAGSWTDEMVLVLNLNGELRRQANRRSP